MYYVRAKLVYMCSELKVGAYLIPDWGNAWATPARDDFYLIRFGQLIGHGCTAVKRADAKIEPLVVNMVT